LCLKLEMSARTITIKALLSPEQCICNISFRICDISATLHEIMPAFDFGDNKS
jgi:hypothetical protein